MLLLRNSKLLTWIVIVTQTQNSLHERPSIDQFCLGFDCSWNYGFTYNKQGSFLKWAELSFNFDPIVAQNSNVSVTNTTDLSTGGSEMDVTHLGCRECALEWRPGVQLQVNVWLRFQCPDIHQAARILDIIEGITRTTCCWSHWAAVPGLRLGLRRAADHFLIVSR